MPKAKKDTAKLKALRLWVQHVGLRLRRRGSGFAIYDSAGSRVDPRKPGTRVDFQKQSQIAPWLKKWMDREIARLS